MSGTKVTTDSQSNNPVLEKPGTITSDSLAGESIASGGAFADKNPGVAASKQPSASTTTNNTDTSGATVLQPAADAEAREAQEGWGEERKVQGGEGLGSRGGNAGRGGETFNATGGFDSSDNGSGSIGSTSGSGGLDQGTGSAQSTGSLGQGQNQENQAPTGASGIPQSSGPHGKSLQEGGEITGDEPNASFTSEIGGENDPGREALRGFETGSAPSAAGGEGPRQYGSVSGGKFDGLGESGA